MAENTKTLKADKIIPAENHRERTIRFDLDDLTAEEMGYFLKGTDVELMSETLAKIVLECPADWGKRDDPATYRKLRWFGDWKNFIIPQLVEAAKNEGSR